MEALDYLAEARYWLNEHLMVILLLHGDLPNRCRGIGITLNQVPTKKECRRKYKPE
jgi:hypothetical protein